MAVLLNHFVGDGAFCLAICLSLALSFPRKPLLGAMN
jgi:hypothetical protein